MIYKKILQLCIFICVSAFFVTQADSLSLPFEEISQPDCRFELWDNLGSNCKRNFSFPFPNTLEQKKWDWDLRRIFTVLWWATYTYGWDTADGAHTWVDIATSYGTPVYSILNGKILISSFLKDWGNVVVIEHDFWGEKIFSTYAHLSKRTVSVWQWVSSGDLIGNVGSTGNSTGNHLHFQIEKEAKFHPFFYTECIKQVQWIITNSPVCQWELKKYSLDPLVVFYEGFKSSSQSSKISTKTVDLETRAEIEKKEVENFLKRYKLSINLSWEYSNIFVWEKAKMEIKVSYGNKPFTGRLPLEWVRAETYSGGSIFPEKVILLDEGERTLTFSSSVPGEHRISFYIGDIYITSKTITVLKKWEIITPSKWVIIHSNNSFLGNPQPLLIVFQTNSWGNIVKKDYNWYFQIASDKRAKFINISSLVKKLWRIPKNFSYLLYSIFWDFSYSDTFLGIPIYIFLPLETGIHNIHIINKNSEETIMEKEISVKNIKDLKKISYSSEVIDFLKQWIPPLNQGYFEPQKAVTHIYAKKVLENYLWYGYLKSWNDAYKKQGFLEKIKNISLSYSRENITRGEATALLFEIFSIPITTNHITTFLDQSGDYFDIIGTLNSNDSFQFKDAFWARYFQPDKKITQEEFLYLLSFFTEKYFSEFALK